MLVAKVIFLLYSALKRKALKAFETGKMQQHADFTAAATSNIFGHAISSVFES